MTLDNFGYQDMTLPELKLIQATGGEDAKAQGALAGDFFLSAVDKIYKNAIGLDIVIMKIQKTRTFWGRTDITGEPPECSSVDAIRSDNDTNLLCEKCPNKVDNPGMLSKEERRAKCLLNYNLLGITVDDQTPFILRASGLSSTPVRELITKLKLNKQIAGDTFRVKIHVGAAKKKTTAGEAFIFTFKPTEMLTADHQAEYKQMASQFINDAPLIETELPDEPAQLTAGTKSANDLNF